MPALTRPQKITFAEMCQAAEDGAPVLSAEIAMRPGPEC
jgi:hypothetical protein